MPGGARSLVFACGRSSKPHCGHVLVLVAKYASRVALRVRSAQRPHTQSGTVFLTELKDMVCEKNIPLEIAEDPPMKAIHGPQQLAAELKRQTASFEGAFAVALTVPKTGGTGNTFGMLKMPGPIEISDTHQRVDFDGEKLGMCHASISSGRLADAAQWICDVLLPKMRSSPSFQFICFQIDWAMYAERLKPRDKVLRTLAALSPALAQPNLLPGRVPKRRRPPKRLR